MPMIDKDYEVFSCQGDVTPGWPISQVYGNLWLDNPYIVSVVCGNKGTTRFGRTVIIAFFLLNGITLLIKCFTPVLCLHFT